MLKVIALSQSIAAVERTFLQLNNNKTVLRNALATNTLEAIKKTFNYFPKNQKESNYFTT